MSTMSKEAKEQLKVAGYTETHSGGLTIIRAADGTVVGIDAVPDVARLQAHEHLTLSKKFEHR